MIASHGISQFFDLCQISLHLAPAIPHGIVGALVKGSFEGSHTMLQIHHDEGNQPIFYPASPDTNRPIGQIVYRVAPQSDWKRLSGSELSPSARAH